MEFIPIFEHSIKGGSILTTVGQSAKKKKEKKRKKERKKKQGPWLQAPFRPKIPKKKGKFKFEFTNCISICNKNPNFLTHPWERSPPLPTSSPPPLRWKLATTLRNKQTSNNHSAVLPFSYSGRSYVTANEQNRTTSAPLKWMFLFHQSR